MVAVLSTPVAPARPMTARQREAFDIVMEGDDLPDDVSMRDLSPICEALDLPFWLLCIPGLPNHPNLMSVDAAVAKRLERLLKNYLAMDDRCRRGVDVFAEHYAQG